MQYIYANVYVYVGVYENRYCIIYVRMYMNALK